jgi:hypothetical protein
VITMTSECLIFSFYIPSVSYERKAGNWFFPGERSKVASRAVMSPVKLETKNHCAGEGQQQSSSQSILSRTSYIHVVTLFTIYYWSKQETCTTFWL